MTTKTLSELIEKAQDIEVLEGDAATEFLLERAEKANTSQRETESGVVVYRQAALGAPATKATISDVGEGAPKMPDAKKLAKLAEKRGVAWEEGFAERVRGWWASDERRDSYGDRVRQKWDFKARFESNPVLLKSHSCWDMPIGVSLDWGVHNRVSRSYKGPALHLLTFVSPDTERSESIYRLVAAGILRNGSVGFTPRKILRPTTPEEREKLGLGPYGVIFEESELVEFSLCSIGANSGATPSAAKTIATFATAKRSFGLQPIDVQVLRELEREEALRSKSHIDVWRDLDKSLADIARTLWPSEKHLFAVSRDIETPLVVSEGDADSDESDLDVHDRLRSLESTIERLGAMLGEHMVGMSQRMDDVREQLEDLARGRSVGSSEDSDDYLAEALEELSVLGD